MKMKNIIIVVVLFFGLNRLSTSQTWDAPINVTNNSVFDQVPCLDVGPGPNVSDEFIYITFSEFDQTDNRWEIAYVWKDLNAITLFPAPIFATDGNLQGWPDSFNWEPSIKLAGGLVGIFIAYRADLQSPPGATDEVVYINDQSGGYQLPVFVTTNSIDDQQPSLDLESNGTVHVAFTSGNIGNLKVWFDQTQIITTSVNDQYPSLVIDMNNFVHIAFAGEEPDGDYEIWYVENTSGQWQITRVTDNTFMDIKPSLWIDVSGFAHIAWQGVVEGDFDIYYSDNSSGAFLQSPIRVTADQVNEEEPILVIDPWGSAHIAYQWDAEQIYYTHNMSGVFTTLATSPTLLSTSPSTQNKFPTMDIDSKNILHLAYQGLEDQETEIYYATTGFPVPIELMTFMHEIKKNDVVLAWQTASESENYGFEVERSFDRTDFQKIGFVKGNGTTTKTQYYEFVDQNIESTRYYYRLKQIDYDGTFSYSKILEVKLNSAMAYKLFANYPNPFNPQTKIHFQIPKDEHVILKVFNLFGEEIYSFSNKKYKTGNHFLIWEGVDWNGHSAPSGIYFYRLETESGFHLTKKMMLIQ